MLAIFVSLTRIVDHFHHPWDVLMGSTSGIVFATIMLIFTMEIKSKPNVFSVREGDPEALAKNQPLDMRQISSGTQIDVV